MNHAGAVGGEVRDPAVRHEGIKQLVSTVFDEMRAVNVHHTGATFAGGPNIRGALGDALLVVGRERTRFAGRINERFLNAGHAVPFGKREHFQLGEIDALHWPSTV